MSLHYVEFACGFLLHRGRKSPVPRGLRRVSVEEAHAFLKLNPEDTAPLC